MGTFVSCKYQKMCNSVWSMKKIGAFIAIVAVASALDDGFTDFWKKTITNNAGDLYDIKEYIRNDKDDMRILKDDLRVLKNDVQALRKLVEDLQNGMNTNIAKIDKHSTDIGNNKVSIEANGDAIVKNKVNIEGNDAEISSNAANIATNIAEYLKQFN